MNKLFNINKQTHTHEYLEHSDDIWWITETSHVGGSSVHPVTEMNTHRDTFHNTMSKQATHTEYYTR